MTFAGEARVTQEAATIGGRRFNEQRSIEYRQRRRLHSVRVATMTARGVATTGRYKRGSVTIFVRSHVAQRDDKYFRHLYDTASLRELFRLDRRFSMYTE